MKLNYRYTIAYAVITFFVLSIGFAIVYAALSRSVTQATIGRLEHLNEVVATRLLSSRDAAGEFGRPNVRVQLLPDTLGRPRTVLVRPEWDPALQARVVVVRLTTYPLVGPSRYAITSRASVIEPSDVYLTGLILVFAWTFVFLLALVVILSELISWRILRPFNATLRGIQQFQLGQKTPIDLPPTRTAEFEELNSFLVRMTARAQRDYQGLQEFSENASHELQTPIASIKAKIELLMDADELAEKQLRTLAAMHDELERLAKINQALTLLAKLEHYESRPSDLADLSQLVPATEAAFADLAEMKGLTTSQHVAAGVRVPFDESLAQLLLNNLFSNAIRHNVPDGEVRVELSAIELLLANTGLAPTAPVEELFGRFKKGNAALDSIGIGLAIVRRIGELYGHQVSYEYAEGWHRLRVVFGALAE
ncbi:HAMP domain-containing histidine kinase [Hymenobacter setariae]|uniref:histidine kinase n=1 Tax=Hymenobacter setariae TaxID=2594794 RepID=A0A558BZ16_9BACT|nr:HAMP domain-containing sensor histidine kinase [Hymenobacter setariae]TVT41751.1 HAMP domain-containing histidine kinase [Hymenobacter setariae]